MPTTRREIGLLGATAAVLVAAPSLAQNSPPTAELRSKGGFKPQYELDVPTPETAQRMFDELAYQRVVQVSLWGLPAVGMQ